MRRDRAIGNFVRAIAVVQLLTLGVCFVPESALASFLAWAGQGPVPHLPFLYYVVRGASYCQAAFGVWLWIIAGDVVRYRPLVLATGGIYLVAAPVFAVIHFVTGMPRWWAIMDVGSCFFAGAGLLILCLRRSSGAGGEEKAG